MSTLEFIVCVRDDGWVNGGMESLYGSNAASLAPNKAISHRVVIHVIGACLLCNAKGRESWRVAFCLAVKGTMRIILSLVVLLACIMPRGTCQDLIPCVERKEWR